MRPDTAAAISLAVTTAVCFIGVLRLIDLNEKEPVWALAALMWSGAVLAAAAALVAGQDTGRETPLVTALTAEIAKAAAIGVGLGFLGLAARARGFWEVNGAVDFLIYGAAAGVGLAVGDGLLRDTFAAAREIQTPVQTDTIDLVWMTLQSTLAEALTGAVLGASLGAALNARSTLRRMVAPLIGLATAIVIHERYLSWVHDGAPVGPDFRVRGLLAALVVVGLVAAAVIYALTVEKRTVLDQLEREPDTSVITREELERFASPISRRKHYAGQFFRGELEDWVLQRWLQNHQVQLALLQHRLRGSRGPERAELEALTDDMRRAIRARRGAAVDAHQPRPPRARTASLIAGAAALVVAGALALVAAGGREPPTATITRSSLFERTQAETRQRQASRPRLRDRIPQQVGAFGLLAARPDTSLAGGESSEGMRLDYRTPDRTSVRLSLARLPSAERADRRKHELANGGDGGRRVWRTEDVVAVADGSTEAVDDFCGALPLELRPDLLSDFRAAMRTSLPSSWKLTERAREFSILDEVSRANVIGSRESYGGSSLDYVRITSTDLRAFRKYRELSLKPVHLGRRGVAYRRVYEWTPAGGQRVRQIQQSFVECGNGYFFTATALAPDFENHADVFYAAVDSLAEAGP